MNIFCTSDCPVKSAEWLDDKRLVKMILETGQLLSTVLRKQGCQSDLLYKSAYQNHPCTLWSGKTRGNFDWLVAHGLAMCSLYTKVYGRRHSTQDLIEFSAKSSSLVREGGLQEFCDCTEFKHRTDLPVTERYRLFMILKWTERDTRPPVFSKRDRPSWLPRPKVKLLIGVKNV